MEAHKLAIYPSNMHHATQLVSKARNDTFLYSNIWNICRLSVKDPSLFLCDHSIDFFCTKLGRLLRIFNVTANRF